MKTTSSSWIILLGILQTGSNAQSHDNNDQCQCYQVQSKSDQAFFVNHRFWDFRYMAQSRSDYTSEPNNVSSTTNGQTSQALQSDAFTKDWGIQDWNKQAHQDSPVPVYNNPQNVFVMQTNNTDLGDSNPEARTYLALRTARLDQFQTAAEVESKQKNLYYFSLRFRARVVGDKGACAGMFAVFDDSNESDVEVLTKERDSNTTTYHYTNQPSVRKGDEVPGASIQVDNLPSWTNWHTHRIDWLPGITRFYLDGQLQAENKVNVPKKPMFIDMNIWSDGGIWSGAMDVGNGAELHVQWVQAVFNTSGPASGPKTKNKRGLHLDGVFERFEKRATKCNSICVVDGTNTTGMPEVVYQSSQVSRASDLSFAVLSLSMLLSLAMISAFLTF